jgi:SAM-dependent methyltransferase
VTEAVVGRPPQPLVDRYSHEDLEVFTPEERARFGDDIRNCAWELLYRKEPELYERLVAGERVHPAVLEWLPPRERCGVEIAAGSGRLTVDIASRFDELIAVEPAAPLRARLEEKLPHVSVRNGFFDAIPVPDSVANLVVSLSAFTPDPAHGGELGLAEMERIAAPLGLIVLIWPSDPEWLADRGFEYMRFPGEMFVEFASVDEAVELARIFYPDAVDEIAARGEARVPYEILGMNPPRDLAWKLCK